MNRYLPAFESLGFPLKDSKSNLGKSLTPVSKTFILVTSSLFKSLAKPRFDNLIQFVNFSLFPEFSPGDKVATFVSKFFYHAEREDVQEPQAHRWVPDIPLSPLHGISKSFEDQFAVVRNTPVIVFYQLANIGS